MSKENKAEKKGDKKSEMMDFRNLKTGEYVLHVKINSKIIKNN